MRVRIRLKAYKAWGLGGSAWSSCSAATLLCTAFVVIVAVCSIVATVSGVRTATTVAQ